MNEHIKQLRLEHRIQRLTALHFFYAMHRQTPWIALKRIDGARDRAVAQLNRLAKAQTDKVMKAL